MHARNSSSQLHAATGEQDPAAHMPPRGPGMRHAELWTGAPISSFVGGARLRDGRKLAADDLHLSALLAAPVQ